MSDLIPDHEPCRAKVLALLEKLREAGRETDAVRLEFASFIDKVTPILSQYQAITEKSVTAMGSLTASVTTAMQLIEKLQKDRRVRDEWEKF